MGKHSAVPLSVAVPLRGAAAHCPPSRAGAVTGTTRPRLLASSFSRRLQGDFPPPSLSASHHHGGSLCRNQRATRPYLRQNIQLLVYHITFSRFVNGLYAEILPVEANGGGPPLSGRVLSPCCGENSCRWPAIICKDPRRRWSRWYNQSSQTVPGFRRRWHS